MFKDYDKYLNASLKVYIFVLLIVFIMKLVGLDYFGLVKELKVFDVINNILPNDIMYGIYTYVLLYFSMYFYLSISCKDNSKKMKIYALITFPFSVLIALIPYFINSVIIFWIIQFLYVYLLCLIYTKFKNTNLIKNAYETLYT